LRQGDPLSPILFDLTADALAIMIGRAVGQGLLTGLASKNSESVSILQYADDTILLFEDNLEQARNLKFLLCLFEQMSGLKINFHKSEVYCLGRAKERYKKFEEILTCKAGDLPMKYLGIPIDEKRLALCRWDPIIEKFGKKMSPWQGRNLVMAGRATLINSSLTSLALYMLSFYRVPPGVRKKMDMHRAGFLWSGDKNKKKYHMISWPVVCLPKDQGGLGILDLDIMNISLLSKWLWKLFNEKGVWQSILAGKYLRKITLGQAVAKPGDSHFWQGLMDVKRLFWPCIKIKIGDGTRTRFWEDAWIKDDSLAKAFPRLYSISLNLNITVATVFNMGMANLRFRRALVGEKLALWNELKEICSNVTLDPSQDDKLVWTLSKSGVFSVKSFYLAMQSCGVVPYKFLWQVKIPLRVKTFLWMVLKKSILTRDVLLHRGGDCPAKCLFCGKNESINHLFFECPLARYLWNVVSCATGFNCQFQSADQCFNSWLKSFALGKRKILTVGVAAVIWTVWKARNLACFEKKWPREPVDVLFRVVYWINYWCDLQVKEDAKLELRRGANLLGRIADEIFKARRGWVSWNPRLGF
jgi:hypothetical protein